MADSRLLSAVTLEGHGDGDGERDRKEVMVMSCFTELIKCPTVINTCDDLQLH